MSQLSEVLQHLHHSLNPASETPLLDAQVLVAFVLDCPRSWILAHPEFNISPSQQKTLDGYLERLLRGEPLPYLLEHWEFYGLDFIVSPDTLIPRPETELLVETALNWLAENPGARLAADVGTGCGNIAVSLAVNQPDIRLLAADISYPALQIAMRNARAHHCEQRIAFLQNDLIPPVKVKFDLICANLPYIPTSRLDSLKVSRWEPGISLDGGEHGLDLIDRLLRQAQDKLSDRAALLLEADVTNTNDARECARQVFPQAEIHISNDLSGRERLLGIYFR